MTMTRGEARTMKVMRRDLTAQEDDNCKKEMRMRECENGGE